VKRDQKARKRYLGGVVPFGWTVGEGGDLVEDEAQQHAIRRMVKLRKDGESLRAVRDAMKAEGFTLSHFSVQKIVEAASAP
jgi:putative DNA-invertase from lambdoid prophage Rac